MKKYIKDKKGKFKGSIPYPSDLSFNLDKGDKAQLPINPNTANGKYKSKGNSMSNNGISKLGDSAEDFYRKATNSVKPKETRLGDALVLGKYYVEIKTASSNTLNQVRAVKYIPLVVYDKRDDSWYIVPPNVIVALVSNRARGQHTENPFESVTVGISQIATHKVAIEDLLLKTLAAVQEGSKHPKLKQIMDNIIKESKNLAEASKDKANAYLAEMNNE